MLDQYLVSGSSKAYYIPDFISQDEEEYLLRKITETPRQKWKALATRSASPFGPSKSVVRTGGEIMQKGTLVPQAMPPFLTTYPDLMGRLSGTSAFASSPHQRPNHVIMNEYLPGQGIMPHEDGPSYHPVVATISLGSHAVFHYYSYRNDGVDHGALNASSSPSTRAHDASRGRSVNDVPVLSVFLEPRSAIITTDALYTAHLHGIDDVHRDTFVGAGRLRLPRSEGDFKGDIDEVQIANWRAVKDGESARVLEGGGELERGTRYSLTCRDVPKVAAGDAFRLLGRR
ncbi:hypothetical protein CONPUDRAFT_129924 [Coniophora puteana RWD-64-598 SS2]|uniref:Fe2OG dioxygenase domain-containing protein n=1 Tax=Coniophora puteana (strain RWD-64-598) TaxID=741705 RepID=A0A5M3MBM9_CONPW|nr:uncharacterized protein CONPUDRAFT_129924 [Coniophora puteana RWD-64-598 SS2]EIW76638.1 hypothetical protein CONPUDRAFT_129924 [Coniophora puteana RWD-64-598 SS2]